MAEGRQKRGKLVRWLLALALVALAFAAVLTAPVDNWLKAKREADDPSVGAIYLAPEPPDGWPPSDPVIPDAQRYPLDITTSDDKQPHS